MDEQVVRRLMTSLKCRHCGSQYGSTNIQVLGQRKELWFLSVHCPHCQNEGLLALSVKKNRSPQPVTDLNPQEMDRFARLSTISTDEVLDLHLLLRDFDGNFAGTFAGE
ncbi:MAG: hypothetical protein V3U31_09160 [Dehalococcoidia bacterium]